MVPFSSRIDGIYPYLDETLVAMELAYRDGDIRRVKEALVSDILKHASIETRSRAANVVVQRFLPFFMQFFNDQMKKRIPSRIDVPKGFDFGISRKGLVDKF